MEDESVLAELEGALVIRRSVFPYFMLVALEAGCPLRALLLCSSPPSCPCSRQSAWPPPPPCDDLHFHGGPPGGRCDGGGEGHSPQVLPPGPVGEGVRGLSRTRGKKCVVTSMPRLMVEPFLWEYLDVERVVGTELLVAGGRCLGVVAPPGIMLGRRRLNALRAALGDRGEFDVGYGDELREAYMPRQRRRPPRCPRALPKALGLSRRQAGGAANGVGLLGGAPLASVSVPLAVVRILMGMVLPYRWQFLCGAALGLRIRAKFAPTALRAAGGSTLYACSHRTLLDPIVAATALRRKLVAVTYSLSPVSEALSPIPTVRLTRDRRRDGETMRRLLEVGDLVVCPREPPAGSRIFSDRTTGRGGGGSMFYGSTVRGYKCLDSIFFLMNPSPSYRLDFLDRVSGGVGSGQDVANRVQKAIAGALGFECTVFTRRDKYRMIAGSDGRVESRN
ncbi:unnamed protein product [Spirodela intermedia]|uniref:Glycerol-3-phosphate acyltransferase RAM2/GPAT1-8 HAD-like domain-containing protein n=1 Tax=Spirodela intermedia TaxID=51605 RepID=A0A7I8IL44_SPIIN|nr:unnamed protein product [Spirodela intermedia]CAA6657892.1 unnamed protein product [Spirodela intermedia]